MFRFIFTLPLIAWSSEPPFDFTIHVIDTIQQARSPRARLPLQPTLWHRRYHAGSTSKVELSHVPPECIRQLFTLNRVFGDQDAERALFAFEPRSYALLPRHSRQERIIADYGSGANTLIESFRACEEVAKLLQRELFFRWQFAANSKDAPQRQVVKIKRVAGADPALQIYIKEQFNTHTAYVRMQFMVADLEQYHADGRYFYHEFERRYAVQRDSREKRANIMYA